MLINERRTAAILGVFILMVGASLIAAVDRMLVFGIGNTLALVLSVSVVFAYIRPALCLFQKGPTRAEHLLASGLVLQNFGTSVRSLMLFVWRNDGEPPDFINSPAFAIIPWVFFVAGIYQLSASGVIDGDFPPDSAYRLRRIFAWAIVVTFFTMVLGDWYLIDALTWLGLA